MQQDTQQNAQSAQDTHHNLHAKGRGLDESRVALVDTACTSCMHSRAWRMAFSRSLPEGQECQVTDRSKTFHFADGSTTSNRIAIWRIPIFIGGRPGQVMSAEVESGSTPLLLSVPSLEALDVVLRVKEMTMEVNTLGVQVPMLKTRTKHLAIEVAYNEKLGYETLPVPKGVSANEDFFVYFMEEAELRLMQLEPEVKLLEAESSCKVQLGARGVRPRDERGTLTDRRKSELDLAMKRVRAEDTQTWRALKHDYTVAEQFATRGFTDTVIFEPWGGSFPVTRMATKEFGWSCSQPLDLLDGYDLLTRGGQKLLWDTLEHHRPFLVVIAFDCRIWSLLTNLSPDQDWEKLRRTIGERTLDLVVAICIFQEKNGRYYLVENPKGSRAWVYRQKLQKLLEEHRGKFVVGDQCAFGKKDEESGLPIPRKELDGWATMRWFWTQWVDDVALHTELTNKWSAAMLLAWGQDKLLSTRSLCAEQSAGQCCRRWSWTMLLQEASLFPSKMRMRRWKIFRPVEKRDLRTLFQKELVMTGFYVRKKGSWLGGTTFHVKQGSFHWGRQNRQWRSQDWNQIGRLFFTSPRR